MAVPFAISYITRILWVRNSNLAWLDIHRGYPMIILNWQMGWSEGSKKVLLTEWSFGGMARRLGSTGTVNWSICTWPHQDGNLRVVGLFIWWLASSKASILREPGGSSIASSYLGLEVMQSLPPHSIDYKIVLCLAQFQEEGNWIPPLEGEVARS